jgi:serine/threonine-protein kinase
MAKLDIDPASAAELNRLLDEALDRAPAERLAWVESLPAACDRLKPQLRQWLARSVGVETNDYLGTVPKLGVTVGGGLSGPPLAAGNRIGPYRLVRELGQGGMGSVWLAERADGLHKRSVALKLPHGLSQHADLRERMAREREILASLEHPNIARLYDAGVTAEGQPYLALEYVEGVPLDVYCVKGTNSTGLDVRARLRLFLQVTTAVAYAHGKLILHRDLKPANILVSDDGHVRLLDFGIAKLLDSSHASDSKLTELAGRALTPDYASPEQILGEPLGVTSDVYSLGVVLFELLTRSRPYKLKRDSRGALEDAIVQVDPLRPSEVASAADRAALRGDLDTIVLKALKKDPALRYQTVAAFADDIDRHLDDRPVVARPDSRAYRIRKFVRRNRVMVAAAAVTSMAIVGGAVVAMSQTQIAVAQRQRSDSVKNLIVSMFENASVESSGGKPVSAIELLRQASATVINARIDDPLVSAEISRILARTFVQVHDLASAETTATNALSTAREQFPPDHIEVLRARLLLTEVRRRRGVGGDLSEEYRSIAAALEPRAREYPQDYLHALAESAHFASGKGQKDAAIALAQRAVSDAEKLVRPGSEAHLHSITTLGLALTLAGKPSEAVIQARRAYEGYLSLHGGNARHPRVLSSRAAFAMALVANDQVADSIRHMEAALADAEQVFGANSVPVGYNSHNLSVMLSRSGRIHDAINAAARGLDIANLHHGRESVNYASRQNMLGKFLLAARRTDEAVPLLAAVADAAPKLFGPAHPNAFDSRALHAWAVALEGDLDRATQLADAVLQDVAAQGRPQTPFPAIYRGQIARRSGDSALAVRLIREGLESGPPIKHLGQRAPVIIELGLSRLDAGEFADAAATLREGLSLLESVGHERTPPWADAHWGLSRIALHQRQYAVAIAEAERAAQFWQEFDSEHAEARAAAQWLEELRSRSKRRA